MLFVNVELSMLTAVRSSWRKLAISSGVNCRGPVVEVVIDRDLHDILSQERAGRFAAAAGSSRAQRLPRAGDLDRFNLERPLRRHRATLRPRQPAWHTIAQQEIAFAGDAAEIADARELPIRTDRTDEGGAGDLIVADVVNLEHEYGGTPRGRAACTVSAARCWSVHSQGAAQLAGRNLRRNKHIC
jgi:hypothetical protein